MTSYAGYPDGVRGIEAKFSAIDSKEIQATCPAGDCDFDGDVLADIFLSSASAHTRIYDFEWKCPHCRLEIVEERVFVDGVES